jgi:hypothetical protein
MIVERRSRKATKGDILQLKQFLTPKVMLPLVAGTALLAATSATVIGMATSQNNLTLDSARVSGNATLFDGSTVETSGYSRLQLKNGTRMDLGAGSQAKVFANRASLDRGMSEIQSGSGFEIDANTLRIRTSGPNAIARIKLDNKAVMVTALNSPVEVLNPAGMLIARVTPGLPLSFMPQAGAAMAFDSSGCVLQKSGAAIIVDKNGNQTYELRGADLRKTVGNQAHVVGTVDSTATPMGGASQVVKVSSVTITTKGGCSAVASTVGASTAAAGLGAAATSGAAAAAATGAAVGAGIGASTTALVVAGVAAATAASLGGAAAAGAFSNSSP